MVIDIKEKKESIEKFSKKFQNEIKEIDYNKFKKLFYVENYFYNSKIQFINDKFYETLLDIFTNILKSYIQEIEYYTNLKPSNIMTYSDYEILTKEDKKIKDYYLKLHIIYKKYHKIYLESKINMSEEVVEYIKESYETLRDFNDYSIKLQDRLIENLNNKLKENKNDESSNTYESSLFH